MDRIQRRDAQHPGATGARTKIGDGSDICSEVAVSGSRVAWSSGSVHVFDLSTDQDTILAELGSITPLDVDGGLVVWDEEGRIVGYDLSTGSRFLVVEGSSEPRRASLSERSLVWMSDIDIVEERSNFAIERLPHPLVPLPPQD